MVKFTDVLGKSFAPKNTTKRINGVPVEIKTYVDVDTFASIIYTIVNTCVEKGKYRAENREIARRYIILKYFTNIEVGEDDIPEIFKCSQSGNWFAEIEREVIKLPIWAEIEAAIDSQITYEIQTRQTAFDKLCADISENIAVDNTQNLADIKEVLSGLEKVDKHAFAEAVVDNAVKKTKKK